MRNEFSWRMSGGGVHVLRINEAVVPRSIELQIWHFAV